ncbi:hypothetical protein Francci3_4382 [Frankia casuarinae]|uniref:Uncharacterized protein n=1 Tax=Frankia casuarinae (strain DSM 45818 / CECT 9043 / HFP020203 / CcI3) TaxID=106370 RepID=Q2J4R4_FRACC|nr:hypothetical protein Francci3_4382 [Frankia casuarinae]
MASRSGWRREAGGVAKRVASFCSWRNDVTESWLVGHGCIRRLRWTAGTCAGPPPTTMWAVPAGRFLFDA